VGNTIGFIRRREMTAANEELSFRQVVDAVPEDVFYAFATAQGWRDWLCDSARFEAREGGSYQLAWASGWYAAGTVKECTRPEKVMMTWRGKDYPLSTDITIELKGEDGKTSIEIHHTGFGRGEEWEKIQDSARRGWETGLENLVSIFSTGEDLRIVRRPMLGIVSNVFNEEIADQLGVPVTKGVRIDQPLESMGAQRAGLQSDDVIVEMGGQAIKGGADLAVALQGKQAGDVIPVVFYRGSEKLSVNLELSRRPIEEFPLDPVAMAKRRREIDEEIVHELNELLEGVTETEAEFNPSPEAWSVKEILAHLIVSEQLAQFGITELICDAQREFSSGYDNVRAHLKAVLKVTPAIPELIDRLKACKEETATLLELAQELKARKGVLWRFDLEVLPFPGFHERGHMEQMAAAIEAARKG
jgi:uncharacterized protein YndB with AHSA1/START domain